MIDLLALKGRNEFREKVDSGSIAGHLASQDIAALLAEVERMQLEIIGLHQIDRECQFNVANRIADLQIRRWIPVTESLPEPNVGVLVVVDEGRQCLAYVVEQDRIDIDKPNAGVWRVLYVGPDWKITSEPTDNHVVGCWQQLPYLI